MITVIKNEFNEEVKKRQKRRAVINYSKEELKIFREMIKNAEAENAKVYKYANRYIVR